MKPGDKVLVDGMTATALCDVDAGEYSTGYPAADWADVLKTGILVDTRRNRVRSIPGRQ